MSKRTFALIGLFVALTTGAALAQEEPTYEGRGYGGPLGVGPNFQQGGQWGPPIYGAGREHSSTTERYRRLLRRLHIVIVGVAPALRTVGALRVDQRGIERDRERRPGEGSAQQDGRHRCIGQDRRDLQAVFPDRGPDHHGPLRLMLERSED
ncbi:MAG: hypothetical protein PVSMB1_18260 [Gemmatimonadaceae bacterium]